MGLKLGQFQGSTALVNTLNYVQNNLENKISYDSTNQKLLVAIPIQTSETINGTASKATELATSQNIQVNLASTSAASFNGTAAASPGVTGTLGIGNGGTGLSAVNANAIFTGNSSGNGIKLLSTSSGALYSTGTGAGAGFGTLPIAQGGTGATTIQYARQNLFGEDMNNASYAKYVITINDSWVKGGYTTIQNLRYYMGLGNTTGVLPVENGGTGSSSLASVTVGTANQVNNTAPVGGTAELVYGAMGTNDRFRILVGGSSDAGYVELATSDNGNEPIYVRQYTGSQDFTTITRTATLLDGSGNTSFPGTVTASSFVGSLSGNATSATSASYVTGGTITLSNAVSGSGTFNSSGNVSISCTPNISNIFYARVLSASSYPSSEATAQGHVGDLNMIKAPGIYRVHCESSDWINRPATSTQYMHVIGPSAPGTAIQLSYTYSNGTPHWRAGSNLNSSSPTWSQWYTAASRDWVTDTATAAKATQLATACNIQTNLASTSAASFNGTAAITPGVTGILPIANGGTGATNSEAARRNLGFAYNASNTAAATAAKTITATNFVLEGGAMVWARPSKSNTADNPTLNVNSTGAYYLVQGAGYCIKGNSCWHADDIFGYVFVDGSRTITKADGTTETVPGVWRVISGSKIYLNDNTDITSGTLPVSRGGTGLTASPSMLTNLASTTAANVLAASPRPGVTGTLPVANGGTGGSTILAARQSLFPDNQASTATHMITCVSGANGGYIAQASVPGWLGFSHGNCTTAAATAAKTAGGTNFILRTGAWCSVKFTKACTATSPTLNVNSTGAKPIYHNNAALASGVIAANTFHMFVYDGTNWNLIA